MLNRYAYFVLILVLLAPTTSSAEPNCSGVPDKGYGFNFQLACFKHDVCYSEAVLVGMDKQSCDNRFYTHMKSSCRGDLFCLSAAYSYYLGVKSFEPAIFDRAALKGIRIRDQIAANNDSAALKLFENRANGQARWTSKDKECSILRGSARDLCLAERNKIFVPNVPGTYNIGNCNTLGIRWKNGERYSNAKYQANALGVPLDEVLNSSSGKDPCELYYKD